MRKFLLIFFVLFFTLGCKSKNSVTGGVLSQKKMQLILWDLMRADQFLADYVLNKDSSVNKTTESLKYYQQIFSIHKVSKEDFQHSFSFYKSHPALLKEIMDSLSAPEKSAPATPVQTEPPVTPAIPQKDSVSKDLRKGLQDTAVRRKMKKPITVD